MDALKPCPFCGGNASIVDVSLYGLPAKRVRCCKCRAGFIPVCVGEHLDYFSEAVTITSPIQAEQQAVSLWNSRLIVGEATA